MHLPFLTQSYAGELHLQKNIIFLGTGEGGIIITVYKLPESRLLDAKKLQEYTFF